MKIRMEMVPLAGSPSTHFFETKQGMEDFLHSIEGVACKLTCFVVDPSANSKEVQVHLGNAIALLSRKKAP